MATLRKNLNVTLCIQKALNYLVTLKCEHQEERLIGYIEEKLKCNTMYSESPKLSGDSEM